MPWLQSYRLMGVFLNGQRTEIKIDCDGFRVLLPYDHIESS